jgi:hypothetical protein
MRGKSVPGSCGNGTQLCGIGLDVLLHFLEMVLESKDLGAAGPARQIVTLTTLNGRPLKTAKQPVFPD